MKKPFLLLILLSFSVHIPVTVQATSFAGVKHETIRVESKKMGENALVLPYAFATDGLGTVLGVGGGVKGYFQDQLLVAGSVFGGLEEVYGGVLGAWDYRPPWTRRFFLTAVGSYGHYPNMRAYTAPFYRSGETRPGSNDSDKDDYVETPGYSNWWDFRLDYVLPIGTARHDGMATYRLKGGILEGEGTGGLSWNPFEGGVTTFVLRQYSRLESFETEYGLFERTIHPMEVGIGYNNTDFSMNPSSGSTQYLSVKHDFGWGDAKFPWTFIEFDASKYFSLGESDWAKQRIVALNFWTGDSPSWEEVDNGDGTYTIEDRPPQYDGGSLGGFYRMRAYPSRRFNDRSAVYSTAEYRYTLRWNPVGNISWLRWLNMDWIQTVLFAEGGRVAEEYDLGELFSDWKLDGGIGLRCLMAGAVVRFDIAASDEGSAMWVMFGHPF